MNRSAAFSEKAFTRRGSAALGVCALLAAFFVFQSWFLGLWPGHSSINDRRLSDSYIHALAHGQSHLLTEPDSRLLTAADPFAPELTGYIVSDASLYRGKYYLYFGIVPFLTLMLPWYELTGRILSPAAGIGAFLFVGYAAYGRLLYLTYQRTKRRPSVWILLLAQATLIFSSGTWPLLARPAIYELENAAAYAFLGVSFLALFGNEGEKILPKMLGLVFAVAAIGCRPNYLPSVIILGIWVISRTCMEESTSRCRLQSLVRICLPGFIIALAIGYWNFHRFDSPLEFGLRYTVSSDPDVTPPLTSLQNTPFSLYRYLIGTARLDRYFPFIQGEEKGLVRPAVGQQTSNQVYGIFIIAPILLGAIFVRSKSKIFRLPGVRTVAWSAFAGNLLILSLVPMSCYRYPADFCGPLSLLAALGVLQSGKISNSDSKFGARSRVSVVTLLLGWTACAAIFESTSVAEISGSFRQARPKDFAFLARPFNRVIYTCESLFNDGPRALRVTVSLPSDRVGRIEPLAVIGEVGAQDFLFLNYLAPGWLQLGFESTGHGGPLSRHLKVDYGRPHEIELRYGSFLPPDDHFSMRSLGQEDRLLSRKMLTVLLDGQIVLDGWANFHPTTARLLVGESPDDPAFGEKFTGKILRVTHPPLAVPASPQRWSAESYGSLSGEFELTPLPNGTSEPLLSYGEVRQGGQILVERMSSSEVRLIWLDSSGRKIESVPFTWLPRQPRLVTIQMSALLPPIGSALWSKTTSPLERSATKELLKIAVDGVEIVRAKTNLADVSPTSIATGQDTLFLANGVMPQMAFPPRNVIRSKNWK